MSLIKRAPEFSCWRSRWISCRQKSEGAAKPIRIAGRFHGSFNHFSDFNFLPDGSAFLHKN